MPRTSLDSERPIMAPSVSSKRASQRFSTYSASPSFTSNYTNTTTSSLAYGADSSSVRMSGMQEIKDLTKGLDRLENKTLTRQRYQPTEQKSDTLSKLALGAKVERALDRRMTNQDAVYTPRSNEKRRIVVLDPMTGMSEKMTSVKA